MSDDLFQEAMLYLIEACGCWNAFDGPAIVRDLRASRGLCRTAILVGPGEKVFLDSNSHDFVRAERDFSAHRGLPDTLYGFDVLQLAPVLGREGDLEALAIKWGTDSVQWIDLPNKQSALEDNDENVYVQAGGDPSRVILELWCD